MLDFTIDFEDGAMTEDGMVQESYDAGSSSFHDLFDSKFNSFNPDSIISNGNGHLKSGQFDLDVEDSDLALAYKQPEPATSPKPGRWM
jgi:hypothetical protein